MDSAWHSLNQLTLAESAVAFLRPLNSTQRSRSDSIVDSDCSPLFRTNGSACFQKYCLFYAHKYKNIPFYRNISKQQQQQRQQQQQQNIAYFLLFIMSPTAQTHVQYS